MNWFFYTDADATVNKVVGLVDKAGAYPSGVPVFGYKNRLLGLLENKYKHSSLLSGSIGEEERAFYNIVARSMSRKTVISGETSF
jgi:hypothetical protein